MMKFIYHGKGNKKGIYKIINLTNGRFYYGSTKRLKKRAHEHKKCLENSIHQNVFLQNDFNKCGSENFIYEVVEVVNSDKKEDLIEREQYYLDQFFDNNHYCYNLCPKADSREGAINLRPYDPTTDGRAKPKTDEWINEVSSKNKQIWNKPEKKQEAAQHSKKRWKRDIEKRGPVTVSNMHTGEIVHITGPLKDFCEERNISYRSFHLMIKGNTKSCSGWYLGTQRPEYIERKGEKRKPMNEQQKNLRADKQWEGAVIKNYVSGEEVVLGKNIKDDCRKRDDLKYKPLRRLLHGKIDVTKHGWFLKENESYVATSMKGICKECNQVFCGEAGLRNHNRMKHC